jgi:hypothetical protein
MQYHQANAAVSRARLAAVSRPFEDCISYSLAARDHAYCQLDLPLDISTDRSSEFGVAQYQPTSNESDRRLMLRLGLGFGAAYFVFLLAWVWATRVRSGRPPDR